MRNHETHIATHTVDRLIVAVDGSERSREAFEYAAILAHAASLPVRLMHVIESVASTGLPTPASGTRLQSAAEVMESCEAYCKWRGIECSTQVQEGKLIPLLMEASTPRDLISIGMKGRFAKAGLGSTTRWLVTHLPCPVMVVNGPPHRAVNRLIGVFDGSDASRRAVAIARSLSQRAGWPETVLAVPQNNARLEEVLDRATECADGAQLITHAPTGEGEAVEIERVAVAARHAVLVVGAYADSWLHQLLFGGMTGHLLSHLNAPVVLAR